MEECGALLSGTKMLSNPQGLLSLESTIPPQLHCEDISF